VYSVSPWLTIAARTHHRDTENTEVAQRISNWVATDEYSWDPANLQ
jgi:hypothetical protein